MSRLIGLVFCILAFSLSACGEQNKPAANTPTGSRVPDDNVFKDQVHALEKAEDVQKTLNEAAARQRSVIEEQAQYSAARKARLLRHIPRHSVHGAPRTFGMSET